MVQMARMALMVLTVLMQSTSLSMKEIAEKFDLNIHSFRKYICKHRPDLVSRKNKKQII